MRIRRMIMKKKLLVFSMVMALSLAAVGCGDKSDSTEAGNSTSTAAEAKTESDAVTEAKSESGAATEAASESGAATETASENGAATEAKSESGVATGDTSDFAGSASGKTYTNGMFGLSFVAPDGGQWTFSDASELSARVGKTPEQIKAMTLDDIKKGGVYPSMMCVDMSSGESVSLILSGITGSGEEKATIEATAETLKASLSGKGTCEVKEGSPIGSTYYVDIVYGEAGVNLRMRQYYCFKDGVAATVTITATTPESLETLSKAWTVQ